MLQVTIDKNSMYITEPLYQWDLNQRLAILGVNVESNVTVHFTNERRESAIVVKSVIDEEKIIASIPNELLTEPYNVIAYIYMISEEYGNTVAIIKIPVNRRAKPTDYIFTTNAEIMNYTTLDARITKYIEEQNIKYTNFVEEQDIKYKNFIETVRGSKIYHGTKITGESIEPTIFSNSEIEEAATIDLYINTESCNIYKCVVGGEPSDAQWVYYFNIKGPKGETDTVDNLESNSTSLSLSANQGRILNEKTVHLVSFDSNTGTLTTCSYDYN